MLRNQRLRTKLFAAFGVILALVVALSAYSVVLLVQNQNKAEAARRSSEASVAGQRALAEVTAMVSAFRAYLLTGRPVFLDNLDAARSDSSATLNRVIDIHDDPDVAGRWNEIESDIDRWLDEVVTPGIAVRRDVNAGERPVTDATAVLTTGPGPQMVAAFENEIQDAIPAADIITTRLLSQSAAARTRLELTLAIGAGAVVVLSAAFGILISRYLTGRLDRLDAGATAIAGGDLGRSVEVAGGDELARLGTSFEEMRSQLKAWRASSEGQIWVNEQVAELVSNLQGIRNETDLADAILECTAATVGADLGVLYLVDTADGARVLKAAAWHGISSEDVRESFRLGEGRVGLVALRDDVESIEDVPPDYFASATGLGARPPTSICLAPLRFEADCKGVLELASVNGFSDTELEFLRRTQRTVGTAISVVESAQRTETLLAETQEQAVALEGKHEELQSVNTELELQTQNLEETTTELEAKNADLERTRELLVVKAQELELASQHKSHFLRHMSHELRTPLNSILVLSELMAGEPDALSGELLEYAEIIHRSGEDLLALINEVLELSRIEAGQAALEIEDVDLRALAGDVESKLRPQASRDVELTVSVAPDTPEYIRGDRRRLDQILKNLISNALKFTEQGFVSLDIKTVDSDEPLPSSVAGDGAVVLSVRDTGIGISADELETIFEPFRQVGPTDTSRGTGLGLSITRELVDALDGAITIDSTPGEGSTFLVYLPAGAAASYVSEPARRAASDPVAVKADVPERNMPAPIIADDREIITAGDRKLLIVEDDRNFAAILLDQARRHGFKGVVTSTGTDALALVERHEPDAITLDIALPDVSGYVVLDRLKRDPRFRHIPVHVISGAESRERSLRLGAYGHDLKPVEATGLARAFDELADLIERGTRRLLVVEDDRDEQTAIVDLLDADDVEITVVGSGAEALASLARESFDCAVVDIGLPDMDGINLIEKVRDSGGEGGPAVIVYTGRDLTPSERRRLDKLAETVIVKDVHSPERLLDESAIFLHRVVADLPGDKQTMMRRLDTMDPVLADKTVLIVDDDPRNVFALTSALEHQGMMVIDAENGVEALDKLGSAPLVDIVLMDIMMPVMDGYDAIARIREDPDYRKTPIIALTAKAAQGERERCIDAGANDYMSKPIDVDQLVSLLRVWLSA